MSSWKLFIALFCTKKANYKEELLRDDKGRFVKKRNFDISSHICEHPGPLQQSAIFWLVVARFLVHDCHYFHFQDAFKQVHLKIRQKYSSRPSFCSSNMISQSDSTDRDQKSGTHHIANISIKCKQKWDLWRDITKDHASVSNVQLNYVSVTLWLIIISLCLLGLSNNRDIYKLVSSIFCVPFKYAMWK